MRRLTRLLGRIGIEARIPVELLFMENFYQAQTLSAQQLKKSSFIDPKPEATIFTELPNLLEHYLSRWGSLNLIDFDDHQDPFVCRRRRGGDEFINKPQHLLATLDDQVSQPLLSFDDDDPGDRPAAPG